MPVVLARIDDRLIHGQVTVGWSEHLHPHRIILADNAVAADPWQSRVYASSVPPSIEVQVLPVARAASQLADPESLEHRILLLTGSPGQMSDLARLGAPLSRVNVGGLHFAPGRVEWLPFVFLGRDEVASLRRLLDMGIELFAQQVPGGREFPLEGKHLRQVEARLS